MAGGLTPVSNTWGSSNTGSPRSGAATGWYRSREGLNYRIEVDGVSHRIDREDGGVVRSPSPAVIVSIHVKPGDTVRAGDRVAVLEAMKMETQVTAPFSGKVRHVMAIPNVQVCAGAPLLAMEVTAGAEAADAARVSFAPPHAGAEPANAGDSRCFEKLEEIRRLVLGFDIDPGQAARLREEWSEFCAIPADRGEILRREDEILNIFVDICSLFQRQPETSDSKGGEGPSAEANLFTYLRMLDKRGDGLPPAFVAVLRRTLAYYGIHSLDRSPALERSLLWIYKSHSRMEHQIAPVVGLLERRLERVAALAPHADESFRTLLDRMVFVTRGLFPAVSDLAREVRYRYFDQPLFERTRSEVYEQAEEHLNALMADPLAPERLHRVHALVECPQPLAGMLFRHFEKAGPAFEQLMLEVLTMRYYRIRTLTGFEYLAVDGHGFASAEYEYQGKAIRMFATHVEFSRLQESARAMSRLIEAVPADRDIVADFYVWHSNWSGDTESRQQEILWKINHAGFARPLRRIVVVVAGPVEVQRTGSAQIFTYRPDGEGYTEDSLYRGVHPMVAKRLHFWRLANFHIERLPSVEDVYLLRAVARNNPKDERLIACAEVRDLTPVRDEGGRVIALPHLERMFTEAAAAIASGPVPPPRRCAPVLEPHLPVRATAPSRSGPMNRTGSCTNWPGSPTAWDWSRWSCAPGFRVPGPASCATWWCGFRAPPDRACS